MNDVGLLTIGIALFVTLLLTLVRVAKRATDPFSSLLVFGVASMVFTHFLENVGMTVNLLPITGIPLPFFSYGGSFMLATWMAIGILVLISAEGRGKADGLVI